jgi:hypothetical protein
MTNIETILTYSIQRVAALNLGTQILENLTFQQRTVSQLAVNKESNEN